MRKIREEREGRRGGKEGRGRERGVLWGLAMPFAF